MNTNLQEQSNTDALQERLGQMEVKKTSPSRFYQGETFLNAEVEAHNINIERNTMIADAWNMNSQFEIKKEAFEKAEIKAVKEYEHSVVLLAA